MRSNYSPCQLSILTIMQTPSTQAPTVSRADVMRLTWQLVRSTKLSFATALKQAWAAIRLKAEMLIKPISFYYRKGDGTTRYAVGNYTSASETSGQGKPASPLVMRYFDTIANGWRSFRIDRLIC